MEITLTTAQVTELMALVIDKLQGAVTDGDDMEYGRWFVILAALVQA